MPEIGSRIGRFRLERFLGQGAMGTVYLAVDPEIERKVAIKVVRADGDGYTGRREEIESRFLKEAKIAGRLQHPNIVTIYDVGRDGETYFIAMEFVEGRPLSHLLRPEIGLGDDQKISLLRQAAEALAHAHDRGVIHRDIKPANILVRSDGVAKVSDFGIGKFLTGAGSELTQTGQMIGSPSYMSPEQIRGEPLDGRADIFALGVVAYEMFTGRRPFPGDSITSVVYQILNVQPRDPAELRTDLPPVIRQIVRRSLAKNKEDRYRNAHELVRDLGRPTGVLSKVIEQDTSPTTVAPIALPAAEPYSQPIPAAAASHPPGLSVTSGSAPTVIVERHGGAAMLFGIAAFLLAGAALVYVIFQSRRGGNPAPASGLAVTAASTQGSRVPPFSAAASSSAPAAQSTSTALSATSSTSAPTVGVPQENPRIVENRKPKPPEPKPRAESPTQREEARSAARPEEEAARPAESPAREPAEEVIYDNVYRTRRGMKFQISPDQARLYIDGKYVGIADDWDDHGGGKVFPFLASGSHRVRATLPGYRDLNLQIVVTPSASGDAESAGDEMKRISRESYPKIPRVDASTAENIYFGPEAGDGEVSVDGKPAGKASQFTAAHPLKLSGPTMHDVVIAGRKPLRILAASTADKDVVLVKVK